MTDFDEVSPGAPGGNADGDATPSGGTAPSPLPLGLWPTEPARAVAYAVEACRRYACLGYAVGLSGVGKTSAAMAAVRDLRDRRDLPAHYVAMRQTTDELRPGLSHIGQGVGASRGHNMGANDLVDALRRHDWGRGAVLVLDEAQYMSDALLHAVRNLCDDLRADGRRIGVLLVGTPDLLDRIKGRKARAGANAFEPLVARMFVKLALPDLAEADYAAAARAVGLAGKDAVRLLATVGRQPGRFHPVSNLLDVARDVAGPGVAPAVQHLRIAAQLGGAEA